jgi:hypothetical protein
MGGTDHGRVYVGEQHGCAVGSEYAQQDARPIGDHRVRVRAFSSRPGVLDMDHCCRVDLVNGREFGSREHGVDGAAAVLVDGGAVVVAAVADVETGELAARYSAPPPEEAVRDAAEHRRADDLHGAHSSFFMMMSSSAWSPTMKA